MYMQHKGWSVREFWHRARDMGFAGIEISHIIWEEDVEGIRPGELPILAVHAPAPKRRGPAGWDAMRDISSPDETKRRWAVAQVEHTIRWAARMDANLVCVHMGTVEGIAREVWALEQRYLAGQRGHPIYEHERERVRAHRATQAGIHLEAARRSLDTLISLAAKEGVRLGLESRRYFHEIPTLEELEVLLSPYDSTVVGFWYDVGHCQALANLTFIPHEAWWNRVTGRLVGVHVHDVVGLRDHLIPGMGEVPWKEVKPVLTTADVITFEVDWYFTEEEVQHGLAYVHRLLSPSS